MIDDGYTMEFDGLFYRPLMEKQMRAIRQNISHLDWIFEPPQVIGKITSEFQKKELFARMAEWDDEQKDLENLKNGIELLTRNPRLGMRSCELCRKYWFDPDQGTITSDDEGLPLLRPDYADVPCDTDTGCEKGHYSNPKEFSAKNLRAWEHYLEWRHVGCPYPNDAIMRRNWMWFGTTIEKNGMPILR